MNAYTYHLLAARHDANRFGNATAGDIIIASVGIVALVLFIRAVAAGDAIMLRAGMIGVTIDFPAAFLWERITHNRRT